MSELNDDIRQAIAKSLPSQTADVLRQRLDEADVMEGRIKGYEKDSAIIVEDQLRLGRENAQLKKLETDAEAVKVNLANIIARERDVKQREEIAELKVEMYKEMADQAKSFVATVFANAKPVYTSTGIINREYCSRDQFGNPTYGSSVTTQDTFSSTTQEE